MKAGIVKIKIGWPMVRCGVSLLKRALLPVAYVLSSGSAYAQQNIDLGQSGAFDYFPNSNRPTYYDIPNWAYYYSSSQDHMFAGVSAIYADDRIGHGIFSFDCYRSWLGNDIHFSVHYYLPGATLPGQRYILDLFNGKRSGRPAAYSIGDGETIYTGDIGSGADRILPWQPRDYAKAVSSFWEQLHYAKHDDILTIAFSSDRFGEEPIAMVFPLKDVNTTFEMAKVYCPD
jgi:hypothetical protein